MAKSKMKLLTTPDEMASGLMGWKRGEVLMVLQRPSRISAGIHTWFCRPMTIAWLDEKRKVQQVVKARPWWFYFPKKPASYVYENTDLKKKIKIGQKI